MSTPRGGRDKAFPPDARAKGYLRRSAPRLIGALGLRENTLITVTRG